MYADQIGSEVGGMKDWSAKLCFATLFLGSGDWSAKLVSPPKPPAKAGCFAIF
jgi:hypothetical protein